MPPKKKAAKKGDKEFRKELLERLNAAGDPANIIGHPCPENIRFGTEGEKHATVCIDMSYRTGQSKAAIVTFYNGRGNTIGFYIPNEDITSDEFSERIGKAVRFGFEESMQRPADEINQESLGFENVEYFGEGKTSGQERAKLSNKASMKQVSCTKLRLSLLQTIGDLVGAHPNDILLAPISSVTQDSWKIVPEETSMVLVSSSESNIRLGDAIRQRAILALSREEAKLHPDKKYHGEKRKWADV